jgi:hypothetical protein
LKQTKVVAVAIALAIKDSVTDRGVPRNASVMPTKYRQQPPVYIHRRGMVLVAHGTIRPQHSEMMPTMK